VGNGVVMIVRTMMIMIIVAHQINPQYLQVRHLNAMLLKVVLETGGVAMT